MFNRSVLEQVPVDRGLEFQNSISAEVKFRGGDKNQDMTIGELWTAKKLPPSQHVITSCSELPVLGISNRVRWRS